MLKTPQGKINFLNFCKAGIMAIFIILMFIPYWEYNGATTSINGFVWSKNYDAFLPYFRQAAEGFTPNLAIVGPMLFLILSGIGIALCIVKRNTHFTSIYTILLSLFGVVMYISNPVLPLGNIYILHLILMIVFFALAVFTMIFGIRMKKLENISVANLTEKDIEERISTIKGFGSTANKDKSAIDRGFNQLLMCLYDEIPECRIAACEMLGNTSREIACTHICYLLDKETNEDVKNAMKSALTSIHKNIEAEHSL